MGEPKPLASLSSSLLARKGQAKPAMRPQGFGSFGFGGAGVHDDLGWNDMGHDHAPAPSQVSAEIVPIVPAAVVEPPPAAPEVVRRQAELVRELATSPALAAVPVRAERAAPGSKGRSAFTLRLDPERHLKLRLACAVTHRSAQQLVVAALDAFLEAQPAVAELARTAGPVETRAKGE